MSELTRIHSIKRGGHAAINKLNELRFDPIYELVTKYREIEKQIEFYNDWRDNIIVPLTSTGKTRTYNQEIHMNLYDKLTNVAEKLLRYGYGRVPELHEESVQERVPLIINLSKEGDTYIIGERNELPDDLPVDND
jgi:hypothetical protein